MLYINIELIKRAYAIINNVKDMPEVHQDLMVVDSVINNYETGAIYNAVDLVELDSRLRQKYIEANTLRILEQSTKWILPTNSTMSYVAASPEIEALKCDRFGILTHILKVAKEIVEDVEMLDKSKIIN